MESQNTPCKNLPVLAISSAPFNFVHTRHPQLLAGASIVVRQVQKSVCSSVDKFLKMVDSLRSQNPVLGKLMSFSSYLHNCCQIALRERQNVHMSSSHNFAAILPGDSVAGVVVANGILNFLNIYNTLLIVRIVLTWFPSAPAAVVSPLSTICDPYLNIFRGIIPPLGGTLDLSPILAFLVLNAFTSTAAALPAELPPSEALSSGVSSATSPASPLTSSQKKWIQRFARDKANRPPGTAPSAI